MFLWRRVRAPKNKASARIQVNWLGLRAFAMGDFIWVNCLETGVVVVGVVVVGVVVGVVVVVVLEGFGMRNLGLLFVR